MLPPRRVVTSKESSNAPCPAAAPDDLPLAQAHVPAASTHRPAKHPARGRRADTRTSVAPYARA
eukprot:3509166-Prymnesium_polylepis.1